MAVVGDRMAGSIDVSQVRMAARSQISADAIAPSSFFRFDPAAARTALISSPARPLRRQRPFRLSLFT